MRVLGQDEENEVHFLTKSGFQSVVSGNPYIKKVYSYESVQESGFQALKAESYDIIIDLHKNLRSKRVVATLGVECLSFNKINIEKWMRVNLNWDILPDSHIVDRYFDGISSLGYSNDGMGMDFYPEPIPDGVHLPPQFVTLALGAAHKTKVIPESVIRDIIKGISVPAVLIGGPTDQDCGDRIVRLLDADQVINMAGILSIPQSAEVIRLSQVLITPDTGMMHIAAALKKPIVAVWGNTIPKFGMYPYYGDFDDKSYNAEVALKCRPCSKIGYQKCPKGHFKCMKEHDVAAIQNAVSAFLN